MTLYDHQIVKNDLPELPDCLYQYLWGRDGLYIRAERENLKALIYHTATMPTRGLAEIKPEIQVPSRVPVELLGGLLGYSAQCSPKWSLFYLLFEPSDDYNPWRMVIPNQLQAIGSSELVDPNNANAAKALVEIRSKGAELASFSDEDDRSQTGFRFYAALGMVDRSPEIDLRIGIYGHFMSLAACNLFELPSGVRDVFNIKLGLNERNPERVNEGKQYLES